MATLDLRKKVLTYINNADERLLKLVKALAESYQKDALEDFILSEEQYQMLDQRRQAHLKGESKSFTWKEVKQNARNGIQK
ncbi:MAG: hypothetical protein L3J20_11440 [Flavobacteriaceae bacterium]|nr:hypothetical protein [Flavobacteriaceae bacterium]